jgi:hypothetical protein
VEGKHKADKAIKRKLYIESNNNSRVIKNEIENEKEANSKQVHLLFPDPCHCCKLK